MLKKLPPPSWINQQTTNGGVSAHDEKYDGKIVFKGPCDLEIVSSYLKASNIVREFTYVGSKSTSVEHHNHSISYLTFPFLSENEKHELLAECAFGDRDMFATRMYDTDTALVFISTLIEGHLGIYRRKKDGFRLVWGEWAYPLTDEANWSLYIENKVYTGENHFTEDWLKSFKDQYEFVGRLTPAEVVENVKTLLTKLPATTSLCLMLGSEMPYEKNKKLSYAKREEYHKELNNMLRELAKDTPRLYLIDFNDFIQSQDDFTNNINHFQRRVYFEAAKAANEIIAQVTGKKVSEKSWLVRWTMEKANKIYEELANIQILRKAVRYVKSKVRG